MLGYMINSKLRPQPGDFLILEGRPEDTRGGGISRGEDRPGDAAPGRLSSQPDSRKKFLAPLKVPGGPPNFPAKFPEPEVIGAGPLRSLIAEKRWPTNRLSLKVVHDRGLFRYRPKPAGSKGFRIDLVRGDRVRLDDRLILRWEMGKGNAKKEGYGLAKVAEV